MNMFDEKLTKITTPIQLNNLIIQTIIKFEDFKKESFIYFNIFEKNDAKKGKYENYKTIYIKKKHLKELVKVFQEQLKIMDELDIQ